MATTSSRTSVARTKQRRTKDLGLVGLCSLIARRVVRVSIIISAALIFVTVIALSPLALRQLGSIPGSNWARLSNIGQTYGAASAVLTGLALIGVVVSVAFQVRATQASREQSSQSHHTHLVEMALEDPVYQPCWGYAPEPSDVYKQHFYLNLIISWWQHDYVLGGFPESALHHEVAQIFRGEAGRRFWAETRDYRIKVSGTRKERRFWRIVNDEYRKAVAEGPPTVSADVSPSPQVKNSEQAKGTRDLLKTGSAIVLGAFGGAVLTKALWYSRLPRR
jgi:hypothetical protein